MMMQISHTCTSQKLLENIDENVLLADTIVGGNHEQGAFCSSVKIVMMFVDHKNCGMLVWRGSVYKRHL